MWSGRRARVLTLLLLAAITSLTIWAVAKHWYQIPLGFLPFIPVLTRGSLYLRLRSLVPEVVHNTPEKALGHQSLDATFIGFSFTALTALTIVDARIGLDLLMPSYTLLISFLAYLSAFNLQKYLIFGWQTYLYDTFIDIGALSLLLAVASVIVLSGAPSTAKYALASLAIAVWFIDHVVTLQLSYLVQKNLAENGSKAANESREDMGGAKVDG